MKSVNALTALLLCFSFLFTSCTPDLDYPPSSKSILSNGSWSVEHYYSTLGRGTQFTQYNIHFIQNGIVECSGANHSCSGSWTIIKDIDGNDLLQIKLNSQDSDMQELSKDWKITSITKAAARLKTRDQQTELSIIKQ